MQLCHHRHTVNYFFIFLLALYAVFLGFEGLLNHLSLLALVKQCSLEWEVGMLCTLLDCDTPETMTPCLRSPRVFRSLLGSPELHLKIVVFNVFMFPLPSDRAEPHSIHKYYFGS